MLLSGKGERIGFGLFELDVHSGELWRSGIRVRLAGQPFKVLVALVRRPGEVVTREELQAEVWDSNTTVDFERALAGTINKIRDALGDSAENPRYVETLTKRGYRFIAPVNFIHPAASEDAPRSVTAHEMDTHTPAEVSYLSSPDPMVLPEGGQGVSVLQPAAEATGLDTVTARLSESGVRSRSWTLRERLLGIVVALLLAAFCVSQYAGHGRMRSAPLRVDQISHYIPIFSGPPNAESFLTLVTDGDRILTSVSVEGRPRLSAIYISTGEVHQLATPRELFSNSLEDISRDGSKLLLRSQLSSESEQPLWVSPSAGGSGLRIGNVLAHDATWMPDGIDILYANGNDLYTVQADGGSSHLYATLPGRAFWMRWSPDGKLLRLTLVDPVSHSSNLYELEAGNRGAHAVRLAGLELESTCCGTWTADGGAYVFGAGDNLWELKGEGRGSALTQLTNGPLRFFSPVAARSGSRIYFLGLEPTSGLQQFSEARHEFQPGPAFLAEANRLDYSRDGVWVAWTDVHQKLWRARALDGSDKVQLTSDSLEVFLAHWSPDGRRLAIMAREHGGVWQNYIIDAAGGEPEPLLHESRNAADPGWSADGRKIVFGREPDLMGKENGSHTIEIFDVQSGKTETIPGSDGLFSPRWSPDGRWIAALTLDQKSLMLYDVVAKGNQWSRLASTSAADPVWRSDSRSIFIHAFQADLEPILQVSVSDGSIQRVADLSSFHNTGAVNYFFGGLSPSNLPMVQTHIGTGNLYTLDLEQNFTRHPKRVNE